MTTSRTMVPVRKEAYWQAFQNIGHPTEAAAMAADLEFAIEHMLMLAASNSTDFIVDVILGDGESLTKDVLIYLSVFHELLRIANVEQSDLRRALHADRR